MPERSARDAGDHQVAGVAGRASTAGPASAADPASTAGPASFAGPAGEARVRGRLAARTQEILDRAPAVIDADTVAFDKAVVHQCRYLMRLLASRRRSAGEMRAKLREREVPADVAHEAMARLARSGLIDDEAFAAEWVRQRRELRALGDEALRRELERKQVEDALIDQALADGKDDEEERCRDLVRSRLGASDRSRLQEERDGAHRRRLSRRLDALLTRKGYPGDLAVRVISSELRAAAQDPHA